MDFIELCDCTFAIGAVLSLSLSIIVLFSENFIIVESLVFATAIGVISNTTLYRDTGINAIIAEKVVSI